jgi:autotransporter-associated beta strand protein
LFLLGGNSVGEPLQLSGGLRTRNGASSQPVTWTGPITLAGPGAQVEPTLPLTISGVISGNGSLTKVSGGQLILSANNTYTGATTNEGGGSLYVNGNQPQSPVFLVNGFLGGTGTVATIASVGFLLKTLSPGAVPLASGVVNCSNVALDATTTFLVHLNAMNPGTGYDQLNVNGTVQLANAALNVVLGFDPAVGSAFTIINNDGSDAVVGTFGGLPEGAILALNGKPFQIRYVGDSGNDVVLTRISLPARFESITPLGNGQLQLQATGGLPGFTYYIEAATDLSPVIQWSNLGSAVADSGGVVSFTDTNAPLFPVRFYRALSP